MIIVILIIIVALLLLIISLYNSLIQKRNAIENAFFFNGCDVEKKI